jgi:hypothetical protein
LLLLSSARTAAATQLGFEEHPTMASTSPAQPSGCASKLCKLEKQHFFLK